MKYIADIEKAFLRPFRRVTSSSYFIPQVDGIRCLAVFIVIVFHLRNYLCVKTSIAFSPPVANDWAARMTSYGNFGVPLFFALSGFILALPFASASFSNKPFRLRNYFTRRLTRLEPPYLLLMLLSFGLLVVVNREPVAALWPHLLASLAYLHSAIYAKNSSINLVTWSLEVEVQFYLLMPVLAWVYQIQKKKLRRSVLVLAMVVSLLVQAAWIVQSPRLSLTILNYIQFFLAGLLLADFYLLEWNVPTRRGMGWDIAGFCGWLSLFVVLPDENLHRWLSPFVTLLIFAAIFRGTRNTKIFSNPWFTTIGGMCYTIYLIHLQVISLIGRVSLHLTTTHSFAINLAIQTAFMLPSILIVSGAVFLVLEKPCMRPSWPVDLRNWLVGIFSPGEREPAPTDLL